MGCTLRRTGSIDAHAERDSGHHNRYDSGRPVPQDLSPHSILQTRMVCLGLHACMTHLTLQECIDILAYEGTMSFPPAVLYHTPEMAALPARSGLSAELARLKILFLARNI